MDAREEWKGKSGVAYRVNGEDVEFRFLSESTTWHPMRGADDLAPWIVSLAARVKELEAKLLPTHMEQSEEQEAERTIRELRAEVKELKAGERRRQVELLELVRDGAIQGLSYVDQTPEEREGAVLSLINAQLDNLLERKGFGC